MDVADGGSTCAGLPMVPHTHMRQPGDDRQSRAGGGATLLLLLSPPAPVVTVGGPASARANAAAVSTENGVDTTLLLSDCGSIDDPRAAELLTRTTKPSGRRGSGAGSDGTLGGLSSRGSGSSRRPVLSYWDRSAAALSCFVCSLRCSRAIRSRCWASSSS
jgi:hypothetical protein